MKKNCIVAAIAVASALLFTVSCQKEAQLETNSEGKTFTAVIDQNITKTTITNDYKVNWESGDKININGAVYSATPDGTDATKSSFTYVSGTTPEAPYTAIYPASLYNAGKFELPRTQTYESGKFNVPMYAESSTESLEFKNICGVICFSLKGTAKVKRIDINAKEALCGAFLMTDATTVSLSGTVKNVTLDCGTGVQLNESTATNFYVYLPPKVYSAGMAIVITDTDGLVFTKTTTKDVIIARSNIYTFDWTPAFGVMQGVFSVSETKKVHFSQGNLYWDGSTFKFEMDQGSFCNDKNWDPEHVSHFYWSKDARVAYSENYEDAVSTYGVLPSENDIFFTNATAETAKADFTVNGITGKFRTLSKDEWEYLLNTRTMTNMRPSSTFRYTTGIAITASIGPINGLVLYPDDYSGPELLGYISGAEDFPEGVVFLPAVGLRNRSELVVYDQVGKYGFYWSSSCHTEYRNAYNMGFDKDVLSLTYNERSNGIGVRLVTDVTE